MDSLNDNDFNRRSSRRNSKRFSFHSLENALGLNGLERNSRGSIKFDNFNENNLNCSIRETEGEEKNDEEIDKEKFDNYFNDDDSQKNNNFVDLDMDCLEGFSIFIDKKSAILNFEIYKNEEIFIEKVIKDLNQKLEIINNDKFDIEKITKDPNEKLEIINNDKFDIEKVNKDPNEKLEINKNEEILIEKIIKNPNKKLEITSNNKFNIEKITKDPNEKLSVLINDNFSILNTTMDTNEDLDISLQETFTLTYKIPQPFKILEIQKNEKNNLSLYSKRNSHKISEIFNQENFSIFNTKLLFNPSKLQINSNTNFINFEKKIKKDNEAELNEYFSIIRNQKENFKNLYCDKKIEFSLISNPKKIEKKTNLNQVDVAKDTKRLSNAIKIPEKRKSKMVTFTDIKENKKENLDEKKEIVYKMKINFKKKNPFNFDNYKKQLKDKYNDYETHNYNHCNILEDKKLGGNNNGNINLIQIKN